MSEAKRILSYGLLFGIRSFYPCASVDFKLTEMLKIFSLFSSFAELHRGRLESREGKTSDNNDKLEPFRPILVGESFFFEMLTPSPADLYHVFRQRLM